MTAGRAVQLTTGRERNAILAGIRTFAELTGDALERLDDDNELVLRLSPGQARQIVAGARAYLEADLRDRGRAGRARACRASVRALPAVG